MPHPTETIQTAHNLTIQFSSTSWQLLNEIYVPDHPAEQAVLLEVHLGSIVHSSAFAHAHHLSTTEPLTASDISRVVVGWAPESQSWHLGLLLVNRPEKFTTRWCGLAIWPLGQPHEHGSQAKRAGRVLAQLLERPFHVIPPPTQTRMPVVTSPGYVAPILPAQTTQNPPNWLRQHAPPFKFEEWQLVSFPSEYVWQPPRGWLFMSMVRIVILAVLASLFLLLSIGTQTSGLAKANPEWLPWLGIGVALVLVGITVRQCYTLLAITTVHLDTTAREVRCQGYWVRRVQWRLPFDDCGYVLLSQTPSRSSGRDDPNQPVNTLQEVWLHLYDRHHHKFRQIASLGQVEGQCQDWETVQQTNKKQGRRRLNLAHYNTPAHHAARLMADTLKTDLWLDIQ